MKYKLLQSVILERDVPEHGLRAGDVGTIVETYRPDGLEVEFMTVAGDTQAVVTLSEGDVREARPTDMLAVRPLPSPST